MRKTRFALLGALLCSAFIAGCGGGADVGVVIGDPGYQPDFDLIALIDGHRLSGVDVFPGDVQTLSVIAGETLELDSSGPVYWDLSAGNSALVAATAGTTFAYQGASAYTAAVGNDHLVLAVDSTAPPRSAIPITVTITSRYDLSQVATVDVLISN